MYRLLLCLLDSIINFVSFWHFTYISLLFFAVWQSPCGQKQNNCNNWQMVSPVIIIILYKKLERGCVMDTAVYRTWICLCNWSYFLNNRFLCKLIYFEASRGAGAQSVTVKPTGCGFDPHSRRWNIYFNLYFHFIALVSNTAQCWVLPINTQCLQNSAESGERSVLTIGSLCLLCQCVYSVKLIYIILFFIFLYM